MVIKTTLLHCLVTHNIAQHCVSFFYVYRFYIWLLFYSGIWYMHVNYHLVYTRPPLFNLIRELANICKYLVLLPQHEVQHFSSMQAANLFG